MQLICSASSEFVFYHLQGGLCHVLEAQNPKALMGTLLLSVKQVLSFLNEHLAAYQTPALLVWHFTM